MSKILFIIAPRNFRDEELVEPKKILSENNTVIIASLMKGECTGMLGARVFATTTTKEVLSKISEFSAVIFVGGSGSNVYHNDAVAHQIAQHVASSQNHILAGICWGVVTLAKAGVLTGRKMTGWVSPSGEEKKIFAENNALFQDKDVVVDGNIVTANGPHAAHEFGMEIKNLIEKLQ
ncbi:MAG: DJ-1/PfpI family protein [Candidatus Aenigmarchaeota archaeon]|nr:DJ-1/PfpI family protein [Candidatus Aenigmarchaeota archaeon]